MPLIFKLSVRENSLFLTAFSQELAFTHTALTELLL